MSDVEKITFIGGNGFIMYIILYIILNGVTFLTHYTIKKALKNKKDEIILNENNYFDDGTKNYIDKILLKQKTNEKIKAYIFIILLLAFSILIIFDIFNLFSQNIILTIYGIIILLSMYTVIPFFEYFIFQKCKWK